MSLIKNRKLWSILLLVIPLAIGIPLAIYFIPSARPKTETQRQSHLNKVANPKDNVELKLDVIIEKLNQLDIRLKKMEASKAITKDTTEHSTKSVQQKKQSPKVESTELKSKHSNSPSKPK
jgi:hypothetical protein